MQRAICRIFRKSLGKFRDDCPAIASEEVRQKNKSKEDFSPPPKYSIGDALGWTTGLILTYEVTHRHRQRRGCFANTSPGSRDRILLYIRNCPFAIAKEVAAQPALTSFPISTAQSVRSPRPKRSAPFGPKKMSIDTTPFLTEPEKFFFLKDVKRPSFDDNESDDEGVHFDPNISKYDEVRANNKPQDSRVTSLAEKVTSDLFSAFGAFKMLTLFKDDSTSLKPTDIPTMEALDILEKGAELSSSRALYNIGVAYDRMNETNLSQEYYKRASDLGHPLASYNVAVSSLKEGNLNEGMSLMQYAAEHGVQEATEVMKLF